MTEKTRLHIGISAGGSTCMWSAGFLSQIIDKIDVISISGSSGGAIVSAFVASNLDNLDIIKESRCKAKPFSDLFHLEPNRIVSSAMTMVSGNINGFISHSTVVDLVRKHIDISKVRCELSVVLTNLSEDDVCSKRLDKHTSKLFPNYIAASAAIPILCEPLVLSGQVLADGGILCPVPFEEVIHYKKIDKSNSKCLILDTWSCMKHEKKDSPLVTDLLKWAIRASVKSLSKYQELRFKEIMDRHNWEYKILHPSRMPINPMDFSEKSLKTAFDIGAEDGKKFVEQTAIEKQ